MSALDQIVFWHWWVFGLAMLILEAFMPGAIFLWMGISAGIVGLLMLLIPLGWEWQFLLFATLSVISVLAWKKYRPQAPAADRPALNRRGEQYVGRSFTLREPIVNGVGTLHVDDTRWRISGADIPAGQRTDGVRSGGQRTARHSREICPHGLSALQLQTTSRQPNPQIPVGSNPPSQTQHNSIGGGGMLGHMQQLQARLQNPVSPTRSRQ